MRAGIYSPYFETFGGGERYVLTIAEYLLAKRYDLTIFGLDKNQADKAEQIFNLKLSGAKFATYQDKSQTSDFDLMFFVSDGSIPFSFAKKNILHFQHPFNYMNQKNIKNKLKLLCFKNIVCNSKFTKGYIDKTYGISSDVLYPPVDISKFKANSKENIIISVGRFNSLSHPKRQEVLINTFIDLYRSGEFNDWKFVVAGNTMDKEGEMEVENLKKLASDFPVEILVNEHFEIIKNYYSKAKVFWHATGFGSNLFLHPMKAEHFGMTTVEAMASGCVPIVYNGGGQPEIITQNKNGFLWETLDELINYTREIANDDKKREFICAEAISRAKDFSKEKFFEKLDKYV